MATVTETMGPPRTSIGVVGWLRKNLFNTWYNTLLTIISLWLIYSVGSQFLVWALTTAQWGVIPANLRLFMVGPYPPDQVWRVWLVLVVVSLMMGLSAGVWGGTMRTFAVWLAAAYATLVVLPFDGTGRLWLIANLIILVVAYVLSRGRDWQSRYLLALWILSFALAMVLLGGFTDILVPVGTSQWGGLLLTFILAVVSIVLSFPLGVLLALGRRSELPVVKIFSIVYIEIIRGVPLVTVLYLTQIMLPLFLPAGMRVDNVVRAIFGFTVFTAAYMAENVRGGLQAIPEGQIEAGMALGLSNALITLFIVLPQALRMVIPTTVGLFISLFKDTTLATIVALLELLGVARSVLAQPEFLGRYNEVYLFVAAVFFIFCYAMSFASYRLEEALGVGKR